MPNLFAVKKQLNSLPNNQFKALVLEQINPEADSIETLFSKEPYSAEWLESLSLSEGVPVAPIVATIFAYMPQDALDKIYPELFSLDAKIVVELLCAPYGGVDGLYLAYMASSPQTRHNLSSWIATLSAPLIIQLFMGKKGLFGGYPTFSSQTHALELLAFASLDSLTLLVKALRTLGTIELYTLFQTTPLALLLQNLFHKTKDKDQRVELLLDLLETLASPQLQEIFLGGNSNITLVVKSSSASVMKKLLNLLERFPDDVVEQCILSHEKSFPELDLIFKSSKHKESYEQVVIEYLTLLNRSEQLQGLLQHEWVNGTLLENLLRHGYVEAAIYYLEHVPHALDAAQLAALVPEVNQTRLNPLLISHGAFHLLQQEAEDKVCEFLTQNREATVDARFSEQRTFAHIAVQTKKPAVLQQALQLGVNPNAVNAQGKTALDAALDLKDKEAIFVLSKCPLTRFESHHLLSLSTFLETEALQQLLDNLKQYNKHNLTELLQHTLPQLPLEPQKLRGLELWLNNPERQTSFAEALKNYCLSTNDNSTFIINYASQCFAEAPSPALLEGLKQIVPKHLSFLVSERHLLEKEYVGLQLCALLFCLPVSIWSQYLRTTDWLTEERVQLDLMLCRALIKPAIYLHLSSVEYRLALLALHDKKASHQNIFILLAQQAELTELDIPILRVLTAEIPFQVLLDCSINRRHPSLLILALERALSEKGQHEANLDDLYQALNNELQLFNSDPSPLTDAMFIQMLQLIQHDALKEHVKQYLMQAELLQKRVTQLFLDFSQKNRFERNSLYFDLMLDCAKDKEALSHDTLPLLLPALPPDAIEPLLTHYQEQLQPRFQAAFNGNEQKPANEEKLPHESELRPYVETLHHQVSSGLIKYPNQDEAFPAYVSWLVDFGCALQYPSYKDHLLQCIPQVHPNTLRQINQNLSVEMQAFYKTYTLLEELKHLAKHRLPAEELLDFFRRTETDELSQFAYLTGKAKRHDLHSLTQYTLKNLEEEDEEEFNSVTWGDARDVSPWLKASIRSLQEYIDRVFSIQALTTGAHLPENPQKERLESLNHLMQTPHTTVSTEVMYHLSLSYQHLFSENEDPQPFLQVLNSWLNRADVTKQKALLATLPKDYVFLILEYCLSGINTLDEERLSTCKSLMNFICLRTTNQDKARWQAIKQQLGQQNLALLGAPELQVLARTVLSEKEDDEELTTDGVWIQRLITSPRFVASCPAPQLKQLVERYRALSLLLKKSELVALNRHLSTTPNPKARPEGGPSEQEVNTADARREYLTKKRDRLLLFRANDSVRALLNQLEDECFAQRETNSDVSEQALQVMYTYFQQETSGLSNNVIFRLADFLYSKAMRDKGDVTVAQSPFLSWLQQNVPHQNFLQTELRNKAESGKVFIYNKQRKIIGYLDESNQAFAFSSSFEEKNDEEIPLKDLPGIEVYMPLFDKNGLRLGTLSPEGRLQADNVFREHSSALLVAKMPIEKLSESEASLDLFLQDILKENAISEMYLKVDSPDKRSWLHQQMVRKLIGWRAPLSQGSIDALVKALPHEALMTVLSQCKQQNTSTALFKAILLHPEKRRALIEEGYTKELKAFFTGHDNIEELFADYLTSHYQAPWFTKGFQLFSQHAKKHPYPDLLTEALLLLSEKVSTHQIKLPVYDLILEKLITRETLASIILSDFLKDDAKKALPQKQSKHTENLVAIFEKKHVLPAIYQLNPEFPSRKCARYRLLTQIFQTQQSRLLPRFEPRLSKRYAWHQREIGALGRFLNQHLTYFPDPTSEEHLMGLKLLNDLVFRAANAAQTSLFYSRNQTLDSGMVSRQLNRDDLIRQVSRFFLVRIAEEAFDKMAAQIRVWFESKDEFINRHHQRYLQQHGAFVDWKKITNQSIVGTEQSKIPVLSVFLLNYSGNPKPLVHLLTDFLSNNKVLSNPYNPYILSQLMWQYPHRDVSHIIFGALKDQAQKNPALIDEVVLTHMIYFHINAHLNDKKPRTPSESALEFIIHLGKTGQYLVAHQCALILSKQTDQHSAEYIQKFAQASTEARVEFSLKPYVEKWYFDIAKFLIRLWHRYDPLWEENEQGLIAPCNEKSLYQNPEKEIDVVHTDIKSGESIDEQLDSMPQFKQKMRGLRLFQAQSAIDVAPEQIQEESKKEEKESTGKLTPLSTTLEVMG